MICIIDICTLHRSSAAYRKYNVLSFKRLLFTYILVLRAIWLRQFKRFPWIRESIQQVPLPRFDGGPTRLGALAFRSTSLQCIIAFERREFKLTTEPFELGGRAERELRPSCVLPLSLLCFTTTCHTQRLQLSRHNNQLLADFREKMARVTADAYRCCSPGQCCPALHRSSSADLLAVLSSCQNTTILSFPCCAVRQVRCPVWQLTGSYSSTP